MFFHNWHWKLATQLVIWGTVFSVTNKAYAQQVIPDNTLPNNSVVNLENNIRTITGGTQRGGNLFHSFERFGVPTGATVNFNNTLDINNIINRVTGGNISNIDGLIRANGAANLFLINPNGIVFGRNARLDIGGSFIGSTADALRFGEDNFFSATNPENTPLLSINPNALFFNQLNGTAPIQNNSIAESGRNPADDFTARGLRVRDGKSLLLVGGDINIDGGGLYAFGGRVELGGLAQEGIVGLNSDGDNFSLSFAPGVEKSNVTLSNQGIVNVRAGDGGSIAVNAGNLEMTGGSFIVAGIDTGLDSDGSRAGNIDINVTDAIDLNDGSFQLNNGDSGGDINIKGSSLTLERSEIIQTQEVDGNSSSINLEATDFIQISETSNIFNGNNGDINIKGSSLTITGSSITQNDGNSGSINLEATDSIQVSETSNIFNGNSGNINLKGSSLTIAGSGIIQNNGNVGSINLEATDSIQILEGNNIFNGNSGDINFKGSSLTIAGGSSITQDNGNSGSINLDATDSIQISEKSSIFNGNSGDINFKGSSLTIAGSSITQDNGNSGSINLDATDSIQISETSSIFNGNSGDINLKGSSLTIAGSSITQNNGNVGSINLEAADSIQISETSSIFNGNSGDINLKGSSLTIAGSGIIQNQEVDENFSSINLEAADSIQISDNSNIINGDNGNINLTGSLITIQDRSVTQIGAGNSGDIIVNANSVSLKNTSGLSTKTENNKNAGNIFVNANEKIFLENNSFFNSDSNGSGNAGQITLETSSLILDDSRIGSNANQINESANAGNINLKADSILLQNSTSIASDTFGAGNAGEIELEADKITLRNSSNIATGTKKDSTGNAGKITVRAIGGSILFENEPDFEAIFDDENPNQISSLSSVTNGAGDAGEIIVTAEEVILRNRGGIGLLTNSTGNAGKLTLNTSLLLLENSRSLSGSINSNSFGPSSGAAGELEINADKIELNDSDIFAQADSGNGGNIKLNFQDYLLLRNGSQISTTAGVTGAGGNGGNITIQSPDGFLIAVPQEDSDITANAFEGSGGLININIFGIFGIEQRAQLTEQSDITAFSQQNPQLDGVINIETQEIDPTEELTELPSAPVEGEFYDVCQVGEGENASEFYIVGLGGIPPSPLDFLLEESVDVGWVELPSGLEGGDGEVGRWGDGEMEGRVSIQNPKSQIPNPIVEATGMIVDDNGDILFVAQASPQSAPSFNNASCAKK